MTFLIVEVPFAIVAPLARRAAREHVSLAPTRETRWFAVLDAGRPIGVAGLYRIGASSRRIKGVWVDPAWRGRGLGDAFVTRLMAEAEEECASAVEALVYNRNYYERRGFKALGPAQRNGAVRVRKHL